MVCQGRDERFLSLQGMRRVRFSSLDSSETDYDSFGVSMWRSPYDSLSQGDLVVSPTQGTPKRDP